jgi:hypothetical protein
VETKQHRCMHCGGAVDADGYALGGEVGEEAPDIDNAEQDSTQMQAADEVDAAARKAFVRAVRMKGGR